MAIRQQNSEPVERGGFYGCRVQASGDVNFGSYCIWTADSYEEEWELSVESIDDLIDLLKELREVKDDDCV